MTIQLHHLNCICACALGGRLINGTAPSVLSRAALCCHCLLLETTAGLVLVDTGYGQHDVAAPRDRLSGLFLRLMSPDFRMEMTAVRQITAMGFRTDDVRHIVLTHLDFDHAGGLDDFPRAQVHLMRKEAEDAIAQRSWLDRQRFRPQQWRDRSRWRTYTASAGETWHGFDAVRQLEGLPPEVLMVPLAGHTNGHAAVAVMAGGHWLLQAGDAYFHRREMDPIPWCTPGLRAYQWLMEKDRVSRLRNQEHLRRLKADQAGAITICCAHDPVEFESLAGRAMAHSVSSASAARLQSSTPSGSQKPQRDRGAHSS